MAPEIVMVLGDFTKGKSTIMTSLGGTFNNNDNWQSATKEFNF